MYITNQDGTKSTSMHKTEEESMKTLGVCNSPAGGKKEHFDNIKTNTATWINRMKNGHLPSHIHSIQATIVARITIRFRNNDKRHRRSRRIIT